MPSPFPGMNPYLERPARWTDFHNSFIVTARTALARQVGEKYFVQVEEHLYLERADEGDELLGVPDLDLIGSEDGSGVGPSAATLVAPVRVTIPGVTRRRLAFLTVRDREGDRVVTVIEMPSPTNKRPGDDRAEFIAKRQRWLASAASYVEIDLLRGGRRLPIRGLPGCDYYALVSRPAKRRDADLWPIQLRDPLPTIPVPLLAGDTEATLELQPLLHEVHDNAGYGRRLYRRPPVPDLSATDAAWAAGVLNPPGGSN